MRLRLIVVVPMILFSSFAALATSTLDFDLVDVVAFSDAVAVVRIDSVKCERRPGIVGIVTASSATVLHSEFGIEVGESITIVTPGGRISDTVLTVSGAPQFASGMTLIVFLSRIGGLNFGIVDWQKGVYWLHSNSWRESGLQTEGGFTLSAISGNRPVLIKRPDHSGTDSSVEVPTDANSGKVPSNELDTMHAEHFLNLVRSISKELEMSGYSGPFEHRRQRILEVRNVSRK